MKPALPSIWLGDFESKSEFDQVFQNSLNTSKIFDWIDDQLLVSRHPFSYPAFCAVCENTTKIKINWMFGGWSNLSNSIHPAWTETGICENCGLNSRMRALIDFLKNYIQIDTDLKVYIVEEITPFFKKIKSIISENNW